MFFSHLSSSISHLGSSICYTYGSVCFNTLINRLLKKKYIYIYIYTLTFLLVSAILGLLELSEN